MLKKALLMDSPVTIPLPPIFFKVLWCIDDKMMENSDEWWISILQNSSLQELKNRVLYYDEEFVNKMEMMEKLSDDELEYMDWPFETKIIVDFNKKNLEIFEKEALKNKLLFGFSSEGEARKKRMEWILEGFICGLSPQFFHEKIAAPLKLNEFMKLFVGELEILGTHLFKQFNFNSLSWNGHEDERENIKSWMKELIENELSSSQLRDFLQWSTSLMRIPIEGLKIMVIRSNKFLAHTCSRNFDVRSVKQFQNQTIPITKEEFKAELKGILSSDQWRGFGYA